MIELISVGIYLWLLFVVGKLLFKVAWGATKIVAGFFFFCSLPVLICGVLLTSSLILLAPFVLLIVSALLLSRSP